MLPRPPSPTLFPYTTLFRSGAARPREIGIRVDPVAHRLRKLGGQSLRGEQRLEDPDVLRARGAAAQDRKSTRLNSSHVEIAYAVFCLKKKKLLIFAFSRPST